MHPFFNKKYNINIRITFKISYLHLLFLLLFFINAYSQTVPPRYLIVNLVKFASCTCVHSFVRDVAMSLDYITSYILLFVYCATRANKGTKRYNIIDCVSVVPTTHSSHSRHHQRTHTMLLSGYAMILLAGSFWMASSLQPLYRSPRSIRRAGRYFVRLQDGASEEELLQQLREGNDDRGRPEFKAHMLSILKSTVNGFVGQLSPQALDMVSLVVVFT